MTHSSIWGVSGAMLALALSLPLTAAAHRTWMVPSATVLSGNDPWVTVDAAVSNDLFVFEHFPLKLDGLRVTAPDGTTVMPENASTGKYRSTFDVHLTQTGTYKLAVLNQGLSASYKDASGQLRRWRGTADKFSVEVPDDASELRVSQTQGRIETFVTAGKPSRQSLQVSGTGLELQPITHPTDLVTGEAANFRLLLDGKPAANVKVEVVPGGVRYRDKLDNHEVTTDTDGKFSVTWPQAGMYWLSASVRDDQTSVRPASERRASYIATMEVLPQ